MATYNGHNEDASGNILLSIGNGMAATLETGTTASQAYTKGAYLYYNNRLCKVTAAIAKSATLTIGTNIAYTTLGAELTSHLRASNGNELYFDYKDGKPGYYPTSAKTASQFVPFGGSIQGAASTLTGKTNATTTVDIGFKPKYLAVTFGTDATTIKHMNVYIENYSTTMAFASDTSSALTRYNLGGTGTCKIKSIDSNGFTVNASTSSTTFIYYFAVG